MNVAPFKYAKTDCKTIIIAELNIKSNFLESSLFKTKTNQP